MAATWEQSARCSPTWSFNEGHMPTNSMLIQLYCCHSNTISTAIFKPLAPEIHCDVYMCSQVTAVSFVQLYVFQEIHVNMG